jgi:hypothetical protein
MNYPDGRLAQGLARFLDMEEVTGSIPVSPTEKNLYIPTHFRIVAFLHNCQKVPVPQR